MKIPKGQKLWETVCDEKGRVKWAITSDPARTVYYLYSVNGDGLIMWTKKTGSPAGFEKYTGVRI
ncbi:MAG: hypothetical protein E7576_07075 [Ruminococcaceae bacterium]|nr:hypothetical protein [Oscillospiraceae bacterium]